MPDDSKGEPYTRRNNRGHLYTCRPLGDDKTSIERNNKTLIVSHPWSRISQAWYYWIMEGQMIQDAFPFLSSGERKFLITRLLDEEFEALFKDTEQTNMENPPHNEDDDDR